MTNIVDSLGTTRFTYDSAGELLSAGGLWSGDTVNYSYNNRFRTSMTLSSWTNSYAYDAAGRLTNLTSGAGAFRYAYDPTRLMQVARISLPNAAYITNTYDPVARLAGTYLKGSGNNTLDGYTYTYDLLGQRTNIFRDFGLMNSTVTAGYDPIGQLNLWVAREANGTGRMNEELQYAYDAAGNLLERLNYGLIQDFKVDPANALTNITRTGQLTVTGNTPAPASSVTVNGLPAQTYADFTFASLYGYTLADGQNSFTNVATNYYGAASVTNVVTANLPASVTLQYDANGNLTNDGSRSFSYDAENQLTNAVVAGQWRSDFFYDGLGRRRIERDYTWQSGAWALTNEMHYLFDGMLIIRELDSSNVAQVTYTRGLDFSGSTQGAGGIGGLLARTDANGSAFYHADGSGNVTALMDSSGYTAARYLYDPFGRLLGKWGTLADANTLQFSSMPRHPASGLSLYAFRAYDLGLQRWLNRDPIGEAGGINLYAYVGNNPVSNIDPFGLENPITGPGGVAVGPVSGLANPALFIPPALLRPVYYTPNGPPPHAEMLWNSEKGYWYTAAGISTDDDPFLLALPLFKGPFKLSRCPATVTTAGALNLAEGEASLVLMKDGQLVAQQSVGSMLTHAEFAAQNGAVAADGSLAPGYWIGTVGKVNGQVVAMNSMTFYGNQLPNANATFTLRSVFH